MIQNLKRKSDNTSNNKFKCFRETVLVIEEEWFDDRTLTDGANSLTPLIKRAKDIVNHNIKLPRDTK